MILPQRLASITLVELRYVGYYFNMQESSDSELNESILLSLYSYLADLLAILPRLKWYA